MCLFPRFSTELLTDIKLEFVLYLKMQVMAFDQIVCLFAQLY